MRFDNWTLYGIHSKTERQVLVGYSSILSLSSLIGDLLVIIGSSWYNAVRMHEILVAIIQHIAISDVLISLFGLLPGSVSLTEDGWIFGDWFCLVSYLIARISLMATNCLVAALALSKLLIVKFPFRAAHFSRNAAHLAALLIWVYSAVVTTIPAAWDRRGVYFSFRTYACEYNCSKNDCNTVDLIGRVVFALHCITTNAVTVVSSLMLILMAKRISDRGERGLRWSGLMTVLLSVAVYSVAFLPGAIFYVGANFAVKHPPGAFLVQFARLAHFALFLNVVSNFYIYTLTLASFRAFLRSIFVPRRQVPEFHNREEREEEGG